MFGWFGRKKRLHDEISEIIARGRFREGMERYFTAIGEDITRFAPENQIIVMVENETLAAFQKATGKRTLIDDGVSLKQQVAALLMVAMGVKQLGSFVFDFRQGSYGRDRSEAAMTNTWFFLLHEGDIHNPSDKAQGILAATMVWYDQLEKSHANILQAIADLYGERLAGRNVTAQLVRGFNTLIELQSQLPR